MGLISRVSSRTYRKKKDLDLPRNASNHPPNLKILRHNLPSETVGQIPRNRTLITPTRLNLKKTLHRRKTTTTRPIQNFVQRKNPATRIRTGSLREHFTPEKNPKVRVC